MNAVRKETLSPECSTLAIDLQVTWYCTYVFIFYYHFQLNRKQKLQQKQLQEKRRRRRRREWKSELSHLFQTRRSWITAFSRHLVKLVPFEWRFQLNTQFSPETSCLVTWRGLVTSNSRDSIHRARRCSARVLIGRYVSRTPFCRTCQEFTKHFLHPCQKAEIVI